MPSLPRRLVVALVAVLAMTASGCYGGDASPTDPAEDVGPAAEATPAPGQDIPQQDTGDELVEPDPGDRDDFSEEAEQ